MLFHEDYVGKHELTVVGVKRTNFPWCPILNASLHYFSHGLVFFGFSVQHDLLVLLHFVLAKRKAIALIDSSSSRSSSRSR